MKKIATPLTSNNMIMSHFGQTQYFKIFTISEENKITDREILDSLNGCGCKSGIAGELAEKGVNIMLAGGIGSGAVNVMADNGITVIRGVSGDCEQAVLGYLEGSVEDSGSSCATHEKHKADGTHEHHHGNGGHHHHH
jgi:predicted Fe-Mo cluster-binding NifX family protein